MYFPSNMNFQYFFLPPIRGISYSSFPVTHDPSVAERCDRIVQMADGRIGGREAYSVRKEKAGGNFFRQLNLHNNIII